MDYIFVQVQAYDPLRNPSCDMRLLCNSSSEVPVQQPNVSVCTHPLFGWIPSKSSPAGGGGGGGIGGIGWIPSKSSRGGGGGGGGVGGIGGCNFSCTPISFGSGET